MIELSDAAAAAAAAAVEKRRLSPSFQFDVQST